jgi:hypothetical protein
MFEHKLSRRALLRGIAATGAMALLPRRLPGLDAAVAAEKFKVADKGTEAVQAFNLDAVRLLPGPFQENQERDAKYLLSLEPDRLLSRFREYAGLQPKGAIYGGWEAQGISGHTLGHYMSACALMYAATGDAKFKQRVDYIVDELKACQDAIGTGLVYGFPNGDKIFAEVAAGQIMVRNQSHFNGGWVPWYTMHKLFAGLRDAYIYCDNATAKAVLVRLSDWACALGDKITDAQFQQMLRVEQGGMNEVLTDVYAITGDEKYLQLAERFNHHAVLDPLEHQEDDLTKLHANTQIPKVIGLAREYEVTGDAAAQTGARFFWNNVTGKRSYVMGGHGDREFFYAIGDMGKHVTATACESCNTYNMLKLTRHLFCWQPLAGYADFYERALYNHILASQDPATGMVTYFVSLGPGHFKTYSTPEDSFWCCVGTGMENHAKYGDSIYFHDANDLYVNLFIPSVLHWADKGMTVRQETKFPEVGLTRLTLQAAQPVVATIRIRHPWWATAGVKVRVNGQLAFTSEQPSTYFAMEQAWKDGDVIEVEMPMSLHVEPMVDDPTKVAVLYGPVVLAGLLGKDGMPAPIVYAKDQMQYVKVADPAVPTLAAVSGKAVTDWLKPTGAKPLEFKTAGVQPGEITFVPLYQVNDQRYSVYWDAAVPAAPTA